MCLYGTPMVPKLTPGEATDSTTGGVPMGSPVVVYVAVDQSILRHPARRRWVYVRKKIRPVGMPCKLPSGSLWTVAYHDTSCMR